MNNFKRAPKILPTEKIIFAVLRPIFSKIKILRIVIVKVLKIITELQD